MANKFKISFGKNSLRFNSMLLAVLMLVLTVFVGTAPINAQAETLGLGNVLRVKTSAATFCGQNVILEAGKTYAYSYYYAPGMFSEGKLLDGNDNEGIGGATVTVTNTIYDDEYHKVTYEFVAPANATSAGEGKVRIYLGLAPRTNGADYYFYGFDVHATDDESKTNLFNDAYFTEQNSLRTPEGTIGNWYKPWDPSGSTLNRDRFYVQSLESLGGLDYFKKTDASSYVLRIEPNTSGMPFFGQWVSLEEGKTYIYSNCYLPGTEPYQYLYKDTQDGQITDYQFVFDNDSWRQGLKFTVPADAMDDPNVEGNKLVWVGFRGHSSSNPLYYYDFKLYDVEKPDVNLLKDYALVQNGASLNTNVWMSPYNTAIKTTLSKATLQDAGGIDTFKKTDADRYVLKLEPKTTGQPYFGQRVSLEAGKTYVYSNYCLPGTDPIQKICYADQTEIASEVIYDNDWSKYSVKFTVPEDAPDDGNGKKLIYVGFRGHSSSNPLYYYGFKLYDVENPEFNLLKDAVLFEGGMEVKADTWKTPSGGYINSKYSEVTLESIGGIDVFKKTDAHRFAIRLEPNTTGQPYFGQLVSLEAGKTYAFSNYCLPGTDPIQKVCYADQTELSTEIIYDNDWSKQTRKFTVPADAPDDGNGKKLIFVGFRGHSSSNPLYYYDFRLYDVENSELNLLKDAVLFEGGSEIKADTWKTPSGNYLNSKYSKVTLESIGGIDVFKKTDAHRYAIKLEPNTTGQPYFGQRVSLEIGKTYVYSNYFLPGTDPIQKVCYPDSTEIATEIIYDNDWSKQSVKFTVPADAPDDGNGKTLIFVGFRGHSSSNPLYYYDFRLYDVENPETNLLKDAVLFEGGSEIKADTWKTPSGNYLNAKYSKVTLESIGGINTFIVFVKKCDVTLDEKIDVRDLVRLKKYVVGSIDTLPEGRGDLNFDLLFNADDLIILRKEILK